MMTAAKGIIRPAWTPCIAQVEGRRDIVRASEPHIESEAIVREWIAYALRNGRTFPPGLATIDGVIVDGNARVAAARTLGLRVWANVVLYRDGQWYATGEVVLLE